ncbi:MAG: sugar ABC transporter, partial [Pelagibacteraceae bacterium]
HDQTEAMSLGTSIAIMNHGIIQQCDSPKVIYDKPQNVFVADFIGSPSMNLIKGRIIEENNNLFFECDSSKSKTNIPLKNYKFVQNKNLKDKSVYFGIRPEHIYLNQNSDQSFEIKLKSELNEYIGHEQIITFNFNDQEILGKFSSSIDIPGNQEINLHFDLAQISLFDQKTEERI